MSKIGLYLFIFFYFILAGCKATQSSFDNALTAKTETPPDYLMSIYSGNNQVINKDSTSASMAIKITTKSGSR